MTGLLFLFGAFLALGLFFIVASILRLPTIGAAKAMLGTVKQERKAAKSLETHLMTAAVRLSKWIHMDEYKRGRMNNILKASGLNLSPEVYQAYAIVKSGAVLSAVIPCLFLLPLLSPVVVILAVLLYFKETQKADERISASRISSSPVSACPAFPLNRSSIPITFRLAFSSCSIVATRRGSSRSISSRFALRRSSACFCCRFCHRW